METFGQIPRRSGDLARTREIIYGDLRSDPSQVGRPCENSKKNAPRDSNSNHLIRSQVLYPLSYGAAKNIILNCLTLMKT